MYMENITIFTKNEKELESLIQTIKIFDQDIRIEFGIEKSTLIVIEKKEKEKQLNK